jgi:hypothetical protein
MALVKVVMRHQVLEIIFLVVAVDLVMALEHLVVTVELVVGGLVQFRHQLVLSQGRRILAVGAVEAVNLGPQQQAAQASSSSK